MDNNNRQRRQNEAPMSSNNPRYQSLQDPSRQQRRSYPSNPRDSYRPGPINPSGPSAGGQRMGASGGYSGYYHDSSAGFGAAGLGQGTMSYHQSTADYGPAEARQTQGFASSTYNPNIMYGVQSAASGTHYDTSQGFSQRQSAGLQMMSADVASPYFQSEAQQATASAMHPQSATAGASQAVYQQPGLQSYSASGMAATLGGMTSSTTAGPDVSIEDYPTVPNNMDEAYQTYQTALREIFQNIRNGVLASAGESLLQVSEWLFNNIERLGLTSDDQNLHTDRIKLWNDLNTAWLAIFQRQKSMMASKQRLDHSQTLITQDHLEKMGTQLVKWCDDIDVHGLVDYQYGVAEEQIIHVLGECLDLYRSPDESNGNGTESSSHHR